MAPGREPGSSCRCQAARSAGGSAAGGWVMGPSCWERAGLHVRSCEGRRGAESFWATCLGQRVPDRASGVPAWLPFKAPADQGVAPAHPPAGVALAGAAGTGLGGAPGIGLVLLLLEAMPTAELVMPLDDDACHGVRWQLQTGSGPGEGWGGAPVRTTDAGGGRISRQRPSFAQALCDQGPMGGRVWATQSPTHGSCRSSNWSATTGTSSVPRRG